MTIDDAITKHKTLKVLAENRNDKRGAFYNSEEHEQIAEWLEELKAYKENSCQQCDYGECHKYHEKSLLEFFLTKENEIKNRTIDNFCAEIKKEYDNDYCPNVSDYLDYKISLRDLFNIAEQLKECGNNDV